MAIKLYKEGKIKREQVFLKEGQIVSKEEIYKEDKPFSVEGVIFQ
jgi:antitoxin component YwqK of YwqJK toxin-antitoxin module